MLIDWVTLIAQIINFLVLVALLKRFLYGPLLKVMDERETTIRSRLEEAEDREKEAAREAVFYRTQSHELEEKRQAMLALATREADVRRAELIKQARREVAEQQARWREAIRRQQETFLQDLRRQVAEHVYAVARRALTDLANVDVEQRVSDVFIERLQQLDAETWTAIAHVTREGKIPAVVRSAFEIPMQTRRQIVQIVRDHLPPDVSVNFETTGELICGIELQAPGHKLAWSLGHYLETLSERVKTALAEATKEVSEQEVAQENKSTEEQDESGACGAARSPKGHSLHS